MKHFFRAYFSRNYWRYEFSTLKAAASVLAAFGVLWLLIEIGMFFELKTPTDWIKSHWWVFCGLGIGWAIWENRPRLTFTCSLKNRDVKIEIRVGDLFAGDCSLVIGCNTSFDTEMHSNLISADSVQGQFTRLYYDSVNHLDSDLSAVLRGVAPESTNNLKRGKSTIYPVGTTAKVSAKGRTAYLCAIAHMNDQGNAHATIEDVQSALPTLWEYIAASGNHGAIAVPVLCSRYARVAENREGLIHEILRSFIAACADQRPCSSLTVVIYPKDYYEYEMNLGELGSFLSHLCKHTDFMGRGAQGRGQPLPDAPGPVAVRIANDIEAPTP